MSFHVSLLQKTLGHKIVSLILYVPIFKNEYQEVKAAEATWGLGIGDKDLDLWF